MEVPNTSSGSTSLDAKSIAAVYEQIDLCMVADQHRLRQKLRQLQTNKQDSTEAVDKVMTAIAKSCGIRQSRETRLPAISFPEQLPISAHEEQLVKLIRKHQVLIVCGETGSGKSTQIPKLCLAAGYGRGGMICQTQPRRIAARSVAERIAHELSSPVGDAVGFRVRFSEQIGDDNYIRVLTDGMLLAEFEGDRFLNKYEVIIIDEAHERSLNIDFLLGLVHQLGKKRPDLRLIITSATLDSEKFSKHFHDAPTVMVSGRTFPVEQRYRPMDAALRATEGLGSAIFDAVEELHSEAPGDVLVFLPGEREIREAATWLLKRVKPGIEVLPLYARLTPKEQHRIFHPSGSPRVILATNVAETSLTVPGVRYVIDSGLARVSRYSPSRKIQRLPLEKIARSAADQRAGRCGRVANGVCIRLYEEDDYLNRPQFTDPEILRTSLADVILRMKSMRLGDIEKFPFVDRPSRRQINDGMQQLLELGALDKNNNLAQIGRQIARMPVDPRIARMLLAAEQFQCLREVIVIAAALSVPDPRQSPSDKIQHARQQHRSLSEEESDFLVLLDIWHQFRHLQKTESKRRAYKWCEENFLSIFRMREWGALQASLRLIIKQMKLKLNDQPADKDAIHKALLSGLLTNIAQLSVVKEKKPQPGSNKGSNIKKRKGVQYEGTFGKTMQLFPGSALQGKTPKWIMSAELMETAQLFARTVTKIDPVWLEPAAKHLLQYHYSDPRWERKQERVIAKRRATLYGLTIYSGRKCDYSKINPQDCRMIFIRSALVDGELEVGLGFFNQNRALSAEIEALEHKTRRRDILVDDNVIYDFYDQHLPETICSATDLRKWHKGLSETQRSQLLIPRELLMLEEQETSMQHFPDQLQNNGIAVPLNYLFDPRSEQDGITAAIKLPLLNQMNAAAFDRLVPGMLREKLVAMLRTLPKPLRRHFVPIPDTIDRVYTQVAEDRSSIRTALALALSKLKGVKIEASHFDLSQLPDYLTTGFSLIDENGREMRFSRDLEELQQRYQHVAHQSFVEGGDTTIEREGLKSWDFEQLPHAVPIRIDQYDTEAYPALVDCDDSVSIAVFDDPGEAEETHMEGVRRLIWFAVPSHRKLSKKPLPEWQQISLMYAAIGDLSRLQLAMFRKAQDQVFFLGRALPRDKNAFEDLVEKEAGKLPRVLIEIAGLVAASLTQYRDILRFLESHQGALHRDTISDVRQQLDWLVYEGFVDDIPVEWLTHLPRYLRGILVRLEQARLDPETDQLRQAKVAPLWNRFLTSEFEYTATFERWRWMLEEYRISIFAQGVGTSSRISQKRLDKIWLDVEYENRNSEF